MAEVRLFNLPDAIHLAATIAAKRRGIALNLWIIETLRQSLKQIAEKDNVIKAVLEEEK